MKQKILHFSCGAIAYPLFLVAIAIKQNQVAEIDLQLCPVSYILKLLGITDLLAGIFRLRH
ncbi:hypothetical protein FBB35_11140 [Nostoc sp. TCL240-02]|nr:hypothetical protein FBB35_11140 [Nostoc sp. TCL240-02]